MGSPEKGVALARSHIHSGILADRTVSQIIGVLLTVSLCQADHRRRNADRSNGWKRDRCQEGFNECERERWDR